MNWTKDGWADYQISVGGIGYTIVDYSGIYGETGRRKWEAEVHYGHPGAGTPKQEDLIGRGFLSLEEAKEACARDMKRRAAKLLEAAEKIEQSPEIPTPEGGAE